MYLHTNSNKEILRLVPYFVGGFVGLIFLITIIMWAFKICPTKDSWIMPSWCGNNSQSQTIKTDKERIDNLINKEVRERVEDKVKDIRLRR